MTPPGAARGDDPDGERAAELGALAEAMVSLDHPVKTETQEWAAAELGGHDRVAADVASEFALDDWRRCAERGILGLTVPEHLGGTGADLATTLLTLEGLGYGCRDNGLAFAVASQVLSTQVALLRFGSDEQIDRWLRPLVSGDALGCFAMTEPDAGSDIAAISTTAVADRGGYVLSGHKAWLTLGSRCDVVIAFASTAPDKGRWGLSAFVVPMDTEGVERAANREKMGMRTTPFGDIVFHDAWVPESAMLGRPGAGTSIFNSVIEIERAFILAPAIGAAERVLDDSIRYAREREQGGGPIARHQAVAHRLVEMKRRHETARLFLYRAALAVAAGRDVSLYAALAKLVGSEATVEATLAAVEVHGARGYVSEFEVERNVRDAIGGLVYSGTTDIQRNIVGRLLGVG